MSASDGGPKEDAMTRLIRRLSFAIFAVALPGCPSFDRSDYAVRGRDEVWPDGGLAAGGDTGEPGGKAGAGGRAPNSGGTTGDGGTKSGAAGVPPEAGGTIGSSGGAPSSGGAQQAGGAGGLVASGGAPSAGSAGSGGTGGTTTNVDGGCDPKRCPSMPAGCSIATPFGCCRSDGTCGCSWATTGSSSAYCL